MKEIKKQEIDIPPEKRQQVTDDLRFWHSIKTEYQKFINLLDTTSDSADLLLKNW